MRRKVVVYYDDEFDTQIAGWLSKIPDKKRSRAVRSLIIAAAMGNTVGAYIAEPAKVERTVGEVSAELGEAVKVEPEREMVHLEFEPE